MINLSELKVFATAAEEMNFSRAAERLHLSQSAVSQSIQSLEKSYGIELFIRRGRSVTLSEEGQTVLPMARELLNMARLLEDSMINIKGEIGGELLIGCSTTAGKYLIPNLLATFQKDYPAVCSRVSVMSRSAILERLLSETIPIGISSKKLDHHEIECQPLFEDRVILIAPVDHPWADYGRAIPADLIDQPLIIREESSGTRETIFEGLKSHGITMDMLNIKMELGNAEAIEMAVENGIGIAFVSELVAARGLALDRVRKVEIDGLELRRMVYIARRVGYPFTRAQCRFWDFAQSHRETLNNEIWDRLANIVPVC